MSDLIKKDSSVAPITQTGKTILNIEKVETVQYNSQVIMTPPNTLPGIRGCRPQERNIMYDYYNLIVYDDDPDLFIQQRHITLPKERCLVEEANITPELKEKYYRLTENNIEELKSYPCIFASVNKSYGETDDDHYAAVGYLSDIKIRNNGIELYCNYLILGISQARLNEVLPTFGIRGKSSRYNELNHSHWTVKAINLREALHEARMDLI